MKTIDEPERRQNLLKALERARLHDVTPRVALEILSTYDGRVAFIQLDDLDASLERPAVIDGLYRELRELSERATQDPSLKDEITRKLGRLRQLQAEEAAEMRERFRARLPFEPGAGSAALEAAKQLLSDDRPPT